MYCVSTNPIIEYSCYPDWDTITSVEDEIIQIVTSSVEEVETRIFATEGELASALDFLVNDPIYQKCTNFKLRKDYRDREQIFENGKFQNLYWLVENYYKIHFAGIYKREITEKANNVYLEYDMIFDRAREQIRNQRGKRA